MMKKILLIFIGILLFAVSSSASVVHFTDAKFQPPNPSDATITVPDGGIDLTFTAGPNDPVNPPSLWWDSSDGFGVQYSYEQEEIEGPESLKLSFSSPFILDAIYIADLFNEEGYTEYGFYQLDGDPLVAFFAVQDAGVTNGELMIDIGGLTVDYIIFSAPGLLQNGQNHEFALQGIAGAPVPLPPAILLLGSGVLGLAAIRRKRKS
jgi:hypothetical protein